MSFLTGSVAVAVNAMRGTLGWYSLNSAIFKKSESLDFLNQAFLFMILLKIKSFFY
jgi:hypothetical protein